MTRLQKGLNGERCFKTMIKMERKMNFINRMMTPRRYIRFERFLKEKGYNGLILLITRANKWCHHRGYDESICNVLVDYIKLLYQRVQMEKYLKNKSLHSNNI